jgi:hypothetical protein
MTEPDKTLRYNDGKPPLDMVPLHLLEGAASVLGASTQSGKYPKFNWALGGPYSDHYASLLRHLAKWARGEDNDEESGQHHLHHAMCNLLFLTHYVESGRGEDDRRPDLFAQCQEGEPKQDPEA